MTHNLLVLSDIHLGGDLATPRAAASLGEGAQLERDQDLAQLLEWYATNRRAGRPWKLIIAGDFVDFVGMNVPVGAEARSAADERECELGASAAHAVAKLRCVAEHHRVVFQGLAAFLEAGNQLVVIRGNHDIDFHWRPVQVEFLVQLRRWAEVPEQAVEFVPWFYYEEGRVFIEHGHQYDPYCSVEHVLHPVCPGDPGSSWRSISDILLRWVVVPTRGMTETGHETAGLFDYVRFAAGLGLRGMLALGQRFARVVVRALRLYRAHMSHAAGHIAREHEKRMKKIARVYRLKRRQLRELASLQHPPLTRSLMGIVAGLMVDRIVVALLLAVFTLLCFVFSAEAVQALLTASVVNSLVLGVGVWSRRLRHDVNPRHQMRERAGRIARVFPAAFVIMGHTHVPEQEPSDTTTYVNLGGWDEEHDGEGFGPTHPASRTHFVLVDDAAGGAADLMVWVPKQGPERFIVPRAPGDGESSS